MWGEHYFINKLEYDTEAMTNKEMYSLKVISVVILVTKDILSNAA